VRHGEVALRSYERLRAPGPFSEELLEKILRGVSAQRYTETVLNAAEAFGVSPSSVSRKLVALTAKKLQEFKERSLADFTPFAIFLDTIHRGGEAFLVALGVDVKGEKRAMGFWQGSFRESRDRRGAAHRPGAPWARALQADPVCDRWRERPHQSAAGTVR
jgi:transposase-like protein